MFVCVWVHVPSLDATLRGLLPSVRDRHARSPGPPHRVCPAAQRSDHQAPRQLPERIRSLRSLTYYLCLTSVTPKSVEDPKVPDLEVVFADKSVYVDILGTDPLQYFRASREQRLFQANQRLPARSILVGVL
jgi:hypothetical protein